MSIHIPLFPYQNHLKMKTKNKVMTDEERMLKAQFYSDVAIGLSIGSALIALLAFILSVV